MTSDDSVLRFLIIFSSKNKSQVVFMNLARDYLLNFQPEGIVLNVDRSGKHSRLIVGRVVRQAQNHLILTLLQQFGIKLKLVSKVVAAHRGAHSTRATLVVSFTTCVSIP
jgi:hypothetical protein